jgi:uncharacterized membrane protein YkvI
MEMHYLSHIDFVSHFSGRAFGKVFSLYLVLTLLAITVSLYAWLSGINSEKIKIWKRIDVSTMCLLFTGALYFFCNYAHYFSNIVSF